MANKAARGKRAKTRHKIRRKGSRPTVNTLLQQISPGTSVDIRINSWAQGQGMPFRRYQGITGKVTGKQGRAYIVSAMNGNQPVELVIGPAHLVVSKGTKVQANLEEKTLKNSKKDSEEVEA